MIKRLVLRALPAALCLAVLTSFAGPDVKTTPAAESQTNLDAITPPTPVTAGPIDGQVAYVTARLLESYQYLHKPFDEAVSTNFFDRYLEIFDPQHLHFTQQDIADFAEYRTNLDHLTVTGRRRGVSDTAPAYAIFNRFMERFTERVKYADELLKNEKFEFNTDERVVLNRHDMPYPKDLDEAKKLWRERVRAEYLQEKLAKIEARKKAAASATNATTAVESKPGVKSTTEQAASKPAAKPKTEAEEIAQTLSHNYHRNLKNFEEWGSDDVMQIYLTALTHVYDPHSDYMGASHLDSFAIGMSLSLSGIGAQLLSDDGYCVIEHLLPGGPAAKSKKIKEKDRIVAVAQSNQPPVDVVNMNINKAVQLIRGPKGTEVRLTILPEGAAPSQTKVITLVRDEVKLEDSEAKGKIIDLANPQGQGGSVRVGVIDLPSFYASFDPSNNRGGLEPRSTSADVRKLLNKFKEENVKGVILDLRRNGGGSLEEAVKLTGLFIKKGPVVQVRDSDGGVQVDDDQDPSIDYDGPLLVLTSRFSASASEILAGALQDYGRALIVGDSSTHGKGTVQSVNTLKPYIRGTNDPGALKVTIKKFYRPSGASTQKRGVVPDIILPSVANVAKDIGETALEYPLEWDTIPSAKFDRLNLVEPALAELRKRSAERIATDKEFSYIREDMDIFRKRQDDKTVSLNEKVRLAEKDEEIAREKTREQERKERKTPAEKVYEITLKQADQPGLPKPLEQTNTLAKAATSPKGMTAASTNAPLASASQPVPVTPEDALDEDKPPVVDAPLNESENILVDYLSVFPKAVLAQHTTDPR